MTESVQKLVGMRQTWALTVSGSGPCVCIPNKDIGDHHDRESAACWRCASAEQHQREPHERRDGTHAFCLAAVVTKASRRSSRIGDSSEPWLHYYPRRGCCDQKQKAAMVQPGPVGLSA